MPMQKNQALKIYKELPMQNLLQNLSMKFILFVVALFFALPFSGEAGILEQVENELVELADKVRRADLPMPGQELSTMLKKVSSLPTVMW